MDWQVVLSTFVGALTGSLPVILLTWWLTMSARKSAARSQRRIEESMKGMSDALQRMAYWGGFDAERQVEADMAAARAKARETEDGENPEDR